MIVHYYKLDKLLKEKKIPKTKFYKDMKLLPSEMSKLKSNRVLSLGTYIKICDYLQCDIFDFTEVISEDGSEDLPIDFKLLINDSYKTPLEKLHNLK